MDNFLASSVLGITRPYRMDRDGPIFMLKSTASGHVIATDKVQELYYRMPYLATALPEVDRLFFCWVLIASMGVKKDDDRKWLPLDMCTRNSNILYFTLYLNCRIFLSIGCAISTLNGRSPETMLEYL
jgi:hypothetical protein